MINPNKNLPFIKTIKHAALMNKVAPNMLKIIFTGTPMSKDTLDEINRGADVFLLKPIKPETLIRIFEEKLKES